MAKKQTTSKTFMKRSSNIYYSQQRRAKEHRCDLPYTLEELREKICQAIGNECPYCRQIITKANFSADQGYPASRGGTFNLSNIQVTCQGCNRAKGNMRPEEFQGLLKFIHDWPEQVRRSLARLKAGTSIYKG